MVVIGLYANRAQGAVPEFVRSGELAGIRHLDRAVVSDKPIVEGNPGDFLCGGTGRVEGFALLEERTAMPSNSGIQAVE